MSLPARQLVSLPSAAELLDQPELAYELPVDAARKMMLRCASLMAALQVAAAHPPVSALDHSGDDFLDIAGVARELDLSRSWVEKNLHRLPEPKMLGARRRWRRADIRMWKRAM
jgi:predicted DNA-binding transcriptional regulator AlpA